MKQRRVKWRERVKTLLIVLLSLSAVYLAGLAMLPTEVGQLFTRLPQTTAQPSVQTSFQSQTLRPAALAATQEDGRYGLLPFQDDQEAYTQFSTLLAEAIRAAGAPEELDAAQWQALLGSPGLFCEYLGEIPLTTLSRWLSGQDNEALAGYSADRLWISEDALAFAGEAGAYTCPLSVSLTQGLEAFFARFTPNGAMFAGEDRRFAQLRPDSLVLDATPLMPQLAATDPVTVTDGGVAGDGLARILQALSFHPHTNPLYAITGGWAITDDAYTLRIVDGVLSFRQSDDDTARYPVEGDPADLTRALAENTVGAVMGDVHLYLQSVEREGDAVTYTYGYALWGAVVRAGSPGWAARFTVEGNRVAAFDLRPRQYTLLSTASALLLPQEQAAAALTGSQNRLLRPVYADDGSGEALSPFWADFS